MIRRFLMAATIASIGALVAACGGGSDASGSADSASAASIEAKARRRTTPIATPTTPTAPLAPVTAVPTGRLLASNCFQCHGTNGRSSGGFDTLAGESISEIVGELREMQTKAEEDKGIMRVHALGYTDAQIQALAAYFASQPR